jgi:hypothetical protein
MLKFYLNRELSTRLEIPLSRWKRWSREFLPPDPLGGLQSGFARQYNIRDAFIVYLAGYLVSVIGFTIPEARQILDDLNGWLKKDVIEPYSAAIVADHEAAKRASRLDLMIIPVQHNAPPAFSYCIRQQVECKALANGEISLWQEEFTEKVIKRGEPRRTGSYPTCVRWVALSAVADQFFERLSS